MTFFVLVKLYTKTDKLFNHFWCLLTHIGDGFFIAKPISTAKCIFNVQLNGFCVFVIKYSIDAAACQGTIGFKEISFGHKSYFIGLSFCLNSRHEPSHSSTYYYHIIHHLGNLYNKLYFVRLAGEIDAILQFCST